MYLLEDVSRRQRFGSCSSRESRHASALNTGAQCEPHRLMRSVTAGPAARRDQGLHACLDSCGCSDGGPMH